jgi:hypothetical protein
MTWLLPSGVMNTRIVLSGTPAGGSASHQARPASVSAARLAS